MRQDHGPYSPHNHCAPGPVCTALTASGKWTSWGNCVCYVNQWDCPECVAQREARRPRERAQSDAGN